MGQEKRCWERGVPAVVALLLFGAIAGADPIAEDGFKPASVLPDLSGLTWVRDDLFLAVHDAKNPEENDRPRVSLLKLPDGPRGLTWKPLDVDFRGQRSSDLESVARIPDTSKVLLLESTEQQQKKPFSNRIFLAEVQGEDVKILEVLTWPAQTQNVEGAAVARAGGRYIFIYAERAHGKASTDIRYAELQLDPLRIGAFRSAGAFTCPQPAGQNARPVSAIEVDNSGSVYAAAAEDPDDDNGPFRSAIYKIGRVVIQHAGPRVVLHARPTRLALLDGMKVESLAVRERPGKGLELFVGLDDENHGGALRPLRLR